METVNNGDMRAWVSEIVWCDHVVVHQLWYAQQQNHVFTIKNRDIKLVVEEGKIKLVCETCFMKGCQVQSFTESGRH